MPLAIFLWEEHLHKFYLYHHAAQEKATRSRNMYVQTHILIQFIFFVIQFLLINLIYCILFFYIFSPNSKLFLISISSSNSFFFIFLHFILHFNHTIILLILHNIFLMVNVIEEFIFRIHQRYIFIFEDIIFHIVYIL